ncbi:MAG: nucleotide kinase domain-containing protein [Ferruginibacter sp.]
MNKVKEMILLTKKQKPKPSIVFDTYWKFAAERQSIFFKRLGNEVSPWSDDKIFRLFKFTNAYRATDRVSQYLIKEIIYNGEQNPRELLFRILLFKLFNKIETWQLLQTKLAQVTYESYDFNQYNNILENQKKNGKAIYSGAYIMASGRSAFGQELKHQNHLKLIESIINDKLHERCQSFSNMGELYNSLKEYPTVGPFLAYQLAIDINYSCLTNFSEMDFVKAGPGAKDGIKKCFTDFGEYSEEDIIKMMADNQQKNFIDSVLILRICSADLYN